MKLRPPKFAYMTAETLKNIIIRIKSFLPDFSSPVALYYNNEPFLHPDAASLLDVLHKHELKAFISSNLNPLIDYGPIVNSPALTLLIVSVSGFRQTVYERGHRGGNIERVLANLESIYQKKNNPACTVRIAFHRYNDNMEDEELMRDFAQKRGFDFYAYHGEVFLVEWMRDYIYDRGRPWLENKDITELVLPRLLPPDVYAQNLSYENLGDLPCYLQKESMFMDIYGNVHTCCMFNMDQTTCLGNILNENLNVIRQRKLANLLCRQCKQTGFYNAFGMKSYLRTFLTRADIQDYKAVNILFNKLDFILRAEKLDEQQKKNIPPAVIYGAGDKGRTIAHSLRGSGFTVKCFIDDNSAPQNSPDDGVPVYQPAQAAGMGLLNRAFIIASFVCSPELQASLNRKLGAWGNFKLNTLKDFIEQYVPESKGAVKR
jgi:hypothetical protein